MNRSISIAMANARCTDCDGTGVRLIYRNHPVTCDCVHRAVFRACLDRFRECANVTMHSSTVTWEFGAPGGTRIYSRKNEEYMADFCLVARRHLTEQDWILFTLYFLLRLDWKVVADRLQIDRGNLFHAIRRVERTLGERFAGIEPYALFPLDEYFGGTVRKAIAA